MQTISRFQKTSDNLFLAILRRIHTVLVQESRKLFHSTFFQFLKRMNYNAVEEST